MRKVLLAAAALSLLLASSAQAISWYAQWREAPIGLKVNVSALPASERSHFLAALNSWNAHPSVGLVEGNGGAKVKVEVSTRCQVACALPKTTGQGILAGVTLHFNPAIFAWGDQQWVYCHELGHALGLTEAAAGDPPSCMVGGTLVPSAEDFATLTEMYG